eukprot:c25751_g1_i1 orf=844-1623(-)
MSIIDGVGDELLYAVLFAAPVMIVFHSSLGLCTLKIFSGGVSIVQRWTARVWNSMWGRGTSATVVPEFQRRYHSNRFSPPENDCCSICHDTFTHSCQANCAHWFCGDCILRVWQHTSALQPCRCPVCRQPINLLIPHQSLNGHREDPEVERVLREIATYNRIHGGGPVGLIQRLRDMPLLLQRMLQDLMDTQRALSLVQRTRIMVYLVALALYVLSPLDILPEGIFGIFGLLDDFFVMLLVLLHLASVYRTTLLNRYGG